MRDSRSPAASTRFRPGAARRMSDSKRSRMRRWSGVSCAFNRGNRIEAALAAEWIEAPGGRKEDAAGRVLARERSDPVADPGHDDALAALEPLHRGPCAVLGAHPDEVGRRRCRVEALVLVRE